MLSFFVILESEGLIEFYKIVGMTRNPRSSISIERIDRKKPSSLTYIQFEYECKSHSICFSDSKLVEPVSCKKQQKKVPNQLLVCGTGDL